MTSSLTPMEARCKVCGDTGSKDQDIDGFLNCTACDAAERRMEMQNYISSLSPNMSNWAKCWAAYNFGMRRPVAAQPSEAAQKELLLKNPQLLRLVQRMDDANRSDDFGKRAREAFEELCEWIAALPAPTSAVSAAPSGYVLVPLKLTHEQLKAMAESRAVDDEGEFPAMLDLLDFSGENKTRTALEAAYVAAITATKE